MTSNVFCPISFHKIDENVARLNGALTTLFIAWSIAAETILPVVFLILDFLARSIPKPEYSAFAGISKFLKKSLKLKPLLINAGPKIFAARIGLLFSVVAVGAHFAGLETLSLVFLVIFGICAFLEASIGYCVACKIYPLFYKIFQASALNKIKDLKFKDFEI